MDEIEGDLKEEQDLFNKREANNLESRNRERERENKLKRELLQKRKAKAIILFENALVPTVEKMMKRSVLNVFVGVTKQLYERTDPLDEEEFKERAELQAKMKNIKFQISEHVINTGKMAQYRKVVGMVEEVTVDPMA